MAELPVDVQREIFEVTARAFPSTAPALARLASHVQIWVERIIYETIVLELPVDTTRLFLRTFYTRPASFFAERVKHLYLTSIITFVEARRLIAACSGVQNLVCWADPHRPDETIAELLPPHHMQRLSIKVEALWGRSSQEITLAPSFDSDIFAKLTHLEIVNPPGISSPTTIDWDGLAHLPQLTHMAFGDLWYWGHKHFAPLLSKLLESAHLEALTVITRDNHLVDCFYGAGLGEDPRFVIFPRFNWPVPITTYWDMVRRGGLDFWFIVDETLNKQWAQRLRTTSQEYSHSVPNDPGNRSGSEASELSD